MSRSFTWDAQKAARNFRKHGVSFEEALTVFDDLLSVTVSDSSHSNRENRFIDIGRSENGRMLVVTYAERGDDRIRIISARLANRRERLKYEESE